MPANVPAEWLRDARGDLALASIAKTPAIRYAHLCFHAQQAAEKSLKAIFSALDQDIPRTHDLAFLMGQSSGNHGGSPGHQLRFPR
jgi:HEPN domain-containing protein